MVELMWSLIFLVFVILFGALSFIAIAYLKSKALMIKDIGEDDYRKIKESYLYHYTGINEANEIMVGENKALLIAASSSYTSKALNFNNKGTHFFINEPSLLNKIYNLTPKRHQKRIKINGANLKRENIIKIRFFDTIIYTCDYCDEAVLEEGEVNNLYFILHEKYPILMSMALISIPTLIGGFIFFLIKSLLIK